LMLLCFPGEFVNGVGYGPVFPDQCRPSALLIVPALERP